MKKRKTGRKKNGQTMNRILIGIFAFIVAFVVLQEVTFWKFQAIPDTLVQSVLGTSGFELLTLGIIKVAKVIKELVSGEKQDDINIVELEDEVNG